MPFVRFIAIIFMLVLGVPGLVGAQGSDTFNIFTLVSGDTTPPTVPANLTATPVATSQIDLNWNASTDNVAVSGYQVFRDASFIATTTLTSYSDTGLTASTTYSYTIRAFDAVPNYSSSTTAVATTTLAASTPTSTPTTTNGRRGSNSINVELIDLSLITTTDVADFSWHTNRYSRYTLRWGRSVNYELGFISTEVFAREHHTRINNLQPDTVYEYELIAYDRRGNDYTLSVGQFRTEASPDVSPPPNVYNLQAEVVGETVVLTWQNPDVADFDRVRVLRSHLFYPLSPQDGFLVYEGVGTTVLDRNAFEISPGQFYTIFTYDTAGNISSGAVVYVTKDRGVTTPLSPTSTQPTPPVSGDLSTSSLLSLNLDDIDMIQDGVLVSLENGHIQVDGSKPLTISIDYDRLPEHLKTITVTLIHPDDASQVFTFLMRVNQTKTAYEATVAPLLMTGDYGIKISVFDYETQVISELSSTFTVAAPVEVNEVGDSKFKQLAARLMLLILLLAGIAVLMRLRRRRT